MALVVRARGSATNLIAPIRKVVHGLDAEVPIFNVETMREVVRASTARLSFALALMSAAAAITLVLGAIGLYGVMTYMVALRTREFGIRIAIGADPGRLARSVALGGMRLLAGGVAGGFVLYALATPFLRAFLHGVTAADPVTLVGATAVLVATALLASWLPARRASRVDPTVALRAD
jgi:ABC-type antimicrobial peptide transport system permease subunit